MAHNNHELEKQRSATDSGLSNDIVPSIPNKDVFDDNSKRPFLTARTFAMTILVSMGGICFGYDTGQISGFQYVDYTIE